MLPLSAQATTHVVVITVDTLRTDRMSSYGYGRPTSPNLDRLLASGVRFTEARTVEPLTAPALASMLTSLSPHVHGSTRNGLRVRPNLPTLPRILRHHGYRTAAFAGSWTLRDRLWGMSSHFDHFEEVLTKARWLGLVKREATAEDLNQAALTWLAAHREQEPKRPVFLWVHYVEPHEPYVLQRDFLQQLGAPPSGDLYGSHNRYDSEIAYVDRQIARFLSSLSELLPAAETLFLFLADHGESLGEHGYWGHGRHLYDVTLRIPFGVVLPARVSPGVIEAPAMIFDVAPTILGLLDLQVPEYFEGVDWTPVLLGAKQGDLDRVTVHQAHKGVTSPKEDPTRTRQRGLLEVGRLARRQKEVLRVSNGNRWLFDLGSNSVETISLVDSGSAASEELRRWLESVREGLARSDELPPASISAEDLEALRALGYIE